MTVIYTANASSSAGREGRCETDDRQISMLLSKPGSGKSGTNPEQLFACGYSACFGSAIDAVAKKKKIETSRINVNASVSLNQDEEKGFFLSITLNATISGVSDEVAKELIESAHKVCPYSKATRGNVEVKLVANGQAVG